MSRCSIAIFFGGALAMAACGGGSTPAPAAPTVQPPANDCTAAGKNVAGVARVAFEGMDEATEAELARVSAEACVSDGWSQAAIDCTIAMTPENEACNDLLDKAQQDAFIERIGPVIMPFLDRGPTMGQPPPPPDDAMEEAVADPCEGGE